MLNLKIIIGGTRPGRAADLVAPWITQAAREHGGGAEAGPAGRAAAAGDHAQARGRGSAVMTASAAQPAAPATSAVVKPSRVVRAVVAPMTRILNPVIVKLAGRRHVRFAAQIRHTGRRSGRQYVTPVGARLAGDTFVIPLTFGNQSDWSRNVRAAGGCSIRLNGVDYRAVRPRLATREQALQEARSAFSPVERAMFRMLGIRQFLLLQRVA